MAAESFRKPEYATHAFEVVRSLFLSVWWEESPRWVRIELLKDLVGNFSPYSVRIFVRGKRETDPWTEPSEYPYWCGDSPDAALEDCFKGLADRAEVVEGMEYKRRLPKEPNKSIPKPDPRPRRKS